MAASFAAFRSASAWGSAAASSAVYHANQLLSHSAPGLKDPIGERSDKSIFFFPPRTRLKGNVEKSKAVEKTLPGERTPENATYMETHALGVRILVYMFSQIESSEVVSCTPRLCP